MTKTILAAALTIAGTVASADTTMKADIPFAFHIPGSVMPAGKYTITKANYPNYDAYFFRNANSTKTLLVAAPIRQSNAPQRDSRLTFRCVADQCELKEIQSVAWQSRNRVSPSLKNNKDVTGTEISMRTVSVTAAD